MALVPAVLRWGALKYSDPLLLQGYFEPVFLYCSLLLLFLLLWWPLLDLYKSEFVDDKWLIFLFISFLLFILFLKRNSDSASASFTSGFKLFVSLCFIKSLFKMFVFTEALPKGVIKDQSLLAEHLHKYHLFVLNYHMNIPQHKMLWLRVAESLRYGICLSLIISESLGHTVIP